MKPFAILSIALLALVAALSNSGCQLLPGSRNGQAKAHARDAVLAPGETIEFKNPNGSGRIIYVSDFVRRYEIGGVAYELKLVQRDRESLHRTGIYNAGASWGSLSMRSSPRFVLDESILRFSQMEEAERFFKFGYREEKWVFGESGLALAYMESPGRYQVNVSLFRCYLNGKLMTAMPERFRNRGFVRLIKSEKR